MSGSGEKYPKDELGNPIKVEVVRVTNEVMKLLFGGGTQATDCDVPGERTLKCGYVDWNSHKIHRENVEGEKLPQMVFGEGTMMGLCILTGLPCIYLAEYNYSEAVRAKARQR